jgi:hypothetical protein
VRLEIWGERWLFLGKPKVGKSTMAATFPDIHAINLDGAMNKYVYPKERRTDCYNIADVKTAFGEARKRHDWTTLIMDPIDKLVTWIDADISEKAHKPSIADIAHGGGYSRQVAQFTQILDQFWALAESRPSLCASIICAHSKSGDDGQSLVIRKALHTYLQGSVNNILYLSKVKDGDGLSYRADLSGSDKIEAGCRNPTLQSAGIVPASFTAILELFNPSNAAMEKALSWMETKGGVDRNAFVAKAHEMGLRTNLEIYEKIRECREKPAMLATVKRSLAQ